MTLFQRVPRQYTNCPLPVDDSHGSLRAARAGCICHDGPQKLAAERARDRSRRRDETVIRKAERQAAEPFSVGHRIPPIAAATDAERRVWGCEDIPCRDEDPELFTIVGDGPVAEAQAQAAKRVCGRCPMRDDCLTAAFEIGDRHTVRGGTTPKERRQMRAQQIEAVA